MKSYTVVTAIRTKQFCDVQCNFILTCKRHKMNPMHCIQLRQPGVGYLHAAAAVARVRVHHVQDTP